MNCLIAMTFKFWFPHMANSIVCIIMDPILELITNFSLLLQGNMRVTYLRNLKNSNNQIWVRYTLPLRRIWIKTRSIITMQSTSSEQV
jgi:hypothetical protein